MILRSFFSKYGVVTGVSMIGYTSGKLLRYVVSFKVRSSQGDGIAALHGLLSLLGCQPGHGSDWVLGHHLVLHRLGEGGHQSDRPCQHHQHCQV